MSAVVSLLVLAVAAATLYFAREQVRQARRRIYYSSLVAPVTNADNLVTVIRKGAPEEVQRLIANPAVFLYECVFTLRGYKDVVADSEPVLVLEGLELQHLAASYSFAGHGDPSLDISPPNGESLEVSVRHLRPGQFVTVVGVAAGNHKTLRFTTRIPDLDLVFIHNSLKYALIPFPGFGRGYTTTEATVHNSAKGRSLPRKLFFTLASLYLLFSFVSDVRRVEPWQQWEDVALWLHSHRVGIARVAQVVVDVLLRVIVFAAIALAAFAILAGVALLTITIYDRRIQPKLVTGRLRQSLEEGLLISTAESRVLDPRLLDLLKAAACRGI
ncbi:MAG TPA: hypothetical protein VK988_08335 [Acidimicrobiales bacterium]|nr:hypothetical protein [Acidimicrobiales bacterium]